MGDMRPKIQYQLPLAFMTEGRGETPDADREGTESPTAKREPENPATGESLMEEVCERENLEEAWHQVRSNQGSPGVDGRTIDETRDYLREHWPTIREQLLNGTYKPQPVRRVEIAKPDGGVRKLGIPTVLDRLIQQAILQVLQGRWDPTFSEHSYGFRPGRSAHQAVAQAQSYVAEGYEWVVDIDLEKFFDRVNHDILMDRVARRISDKRLLRLIRAYLNAGVMEDGLVSPTDEGVPQGGPLSPLLSNLVLDEFDRELTRRGLRFCRYADDCNIYVRSRRSGERVMASVCRFLTTRLQLKVNESKSAVARSGERKFLGFTISNDAEPTRQIAAKALQKFKERIRELTMSDARRQSAAVDRASGAIPDRLARLLRLLPDADRAAEPRRLDSSPITHVYLATVEERADSVCATAPPGCVPLPRGRCCRGRVWVLAHGSPCDSAAGPAQRLLRLDRPSSIGGTANRLTRSNRRGTDPYARWCGRGGAARLPPIPINPLYFPLRSDKLRSMKMHAWNRGVVFEAEGSTMREGSRQFTLQWIDGFGGGVRVRGIPIHDGMSSGKQRMKLAVSITDNIYWICFWSHALLGGVSWWCPADSVRQSRLLPIEEIRVSDSGGD